MKYRYRQIIVRYGDTVLCSVVPVYCNNKVMCRVTLYNGRVKHDKNGVGHCTVWCLKLLCVSVVKMEENSRAVQYMTYQKLPEHVPIQVYRSTPKLT